MLGSVHRTYWIANWPRYDVGPNWLEPLLLDCGTIRTVSLIAQPVAPSRSRRQIERDATKLVTDAEQRSRAGFRIGADHVRTSESVAQREGELAGGYAEFTYSGLITITASDDSALRSSCLAYEQLAAQCGLTLQCLDGNHDLGLVCSLPVGRGPATRRFLS